MKKTTAQGLRVPRTIDPKNAQILRAMQTEVEAILPHCHIINQTAEPPALIRMGEAGAWGRVWYDGDNTPRAWDFEGFTVTCEPVKLPVLFARLCKTFRATYTAPAWGLAPVSSPVEVEQTAPTVEVAEPSPVVEDVAPVEVSTETQQERPARRSLGRMAVRVVVALLLVVIAVLRVCVAALRLAERGRLGEVVRHRVAVRLRLYRARAHRVQVVAVRRVQGMRLMVLYRVEVSKERARARVVHAVEGVRRRAVVRYGRAVQRVESVRASIVEAIGCAGRRVVQGVERVQCATRRASGRVVQGASVATLSLVIVARRLDSFANHLETI